MSTHSDKEAVDAANTALAMLREGHAAKAFELAEQKLKAFENHPALLQVNGLSALQLGNNKHAVASLKAALTSNPEQPGLWEIYGGALELLEEYGAALEAYTEAADRTPDQPSGHRLRGMTLSQLNRHEEAREAFRTALKLSGQDAELWLLKGGADYALSELVAAEAAFENAITLDPDFAKAWVNLATVQSEQGQRESALDNFQTAIRLAPQDPAILRQVATALWDLHLPEQAETLFKSVLKLSPEDTTALATLATLYEQTNRLDDARSYAERTLALDTNNLQGRKVQAVLERRKGDPTKALGEVEKLFAQVSNDADRESLTFELARLNDKIGHTDEAYARFEQANSLQANSRAGKRVNGAAYLQQVERETDIITETPPNLSPSEVYTDAQPDPVFLIGFPRSGTTLLDQVLDSHPDAAVMDERPPLADVHERITRLEEASNQAFVQLDEEQRRVARKFYFDRVKRFVPNFEGKLFIDKNPLGTSKVRIIKLLFPQARIVFALRHPCDVVLSCFMQRFTLNIAMSNFHTLRGAVTAYESVMGLWLKSDQGLGLPVHNIRYEDVVQDFETEIRGLLRFLNLPWHKRVAAFHEHAQTRHVRTASSAQVTEPLYATAVARWRRYNKYLAPHLDVLRPFIDAFGYQTDIQGGN